MSPDLIFATSHVRRLTKLTERLTARLEDETAAFAARRSQDIAAGMAETQEMANQYRRDSAQVKIDPAALVAAPLADRKALIAATRTFEGVLARHSKAVEAARVISEGLVKTVAQEVAAGRALGTGYGASGLAAAGDGRAVTLNRMA